MQYFAIKMHHTSQTLNKFLILRFYMNEIIYVPTYRDVPILTQESVHKLLVGKIYHANIAPRIYI